MKQELIASKVIINYINSLLSSLYQKNVILDFYIIENCLFLETTYKEGSNKVIISKSKINMDIDDIGLLYLELYNLFKEEFIEKENIKVQVVKEFDFSNIDNPYISLKIHDIHQNEINLRLKNLGNEKKELYTIENDLIKLYEEKRTSRKH